MDTYNIINNAFVQLTNEIWELEGRAIITDEFRDITNNDMHIIEAVGVEDGNNMSTLAKKLNVTVGTLTTSMNGLVKKGYVERSRSDSDRRVVMIRLTEKGIAAYHHHAAFHKKLTDSVLEALDGEEAQILAKTLNKLTEFFYSYKNEE